MIKKSTAHEKEIRANMRGGTGDIKIRHYFKSNEINARCRLCAELVIAPSNSIGLHDHTNEDEIFIVQQGEGIVIDDGQEVEIAAGDAILTGKGNSHAIRNIGNSDLIVTAIIMQY